ncbi:MAG: tRNA glutamyl-Q(34) synthetase GluQRS [Leptolyngbya sp. PLA3]|nr:MAG: tRNA glutamyl-Q(34) synthetase GluQRS [Cyanobacteria bacterium CYA]MCE7968493.1 tRNA glutamyl-Q(34) synthetase GluQRS [Leptolyngbya sp. PL-A3]
MPATTLTNPGRTRLAPSPTGALHLGNARTFLVNWALARQNGWGVILRIEDLDTPRVKPGSIEQTIDTLAWLGLDWDQGPLVQSHDLEPYRAAMRSLARRGLTYACELTRGQVEAAASAPQEGVHEVRFPPQLRPAARAGSFDREDTNWRFACPQAVVEFDDRFRGPTRVDPAAEVGDFVIWTRRGQPSYQLAVVVDDHRQGVTHVVRGDDLLGSAGRQLLLYRALGLGPEPAWCHLPLVRGSDGRRLAKRHGDTRLSAYRQRRVGPERVIGLMARWCGMVDRAEPMSADAFRRSLRLDRISRQDIVFTEEDERWLQARS